MKLKVNPIRCMVNARLKTVGLSNFGYFTMLEEDAKMKRFPVLLDCHERKQYDDCPDSIPWELIEPYRVRACKNQHQQTLENLARQGGLSPDELVAVIEERRWKSMTMRDAVNRLKQIVERYRFSKESN